MPSNSFIAMGLALGVVSTTLLSTAVAETYTVMPGEFQRALDEVKPGDTIELTAGEYYESVITRTAGTADEPITIRGESHKAILKGDEDGSDHIFALQHSYYILDQFTIDGRLSDDVYQDKCLYVQTNREEAEPAKEIEFNGHSFRSSLNGIVIANMEIRNCGGECVRLRYFVTYAQVYNNRIENCGVDDFVLDPDGGKNGEGIYVGTSSNQWDDGKNPTSDPDVSQYNRIFNNHFDTQGNEGIDIKEGSTNNIVENNYCTGQKDVESACLDARGSGNVIRYNTIENNLGAGVRLGGHEIDGYTYGVDNDVYGNMMKNNEYAGIKAVVGPQGIICENSIEGSDDAGRGEGMEGIDPSAACSSTATLNIESNESATAQKQEDKETEEPTWSPVTRPAYMSAENYRADKAKKDYVKAEMETPVNLLRARGLCE